MEREKDRQTDRQNHKSCRATAHSTESHLLYNVIECARVCAVCAVRVAPRVAQREERVSVASKSYRYRYARTGIYIYIDMIRDEGAWVVLCIGLWAHPRAHTCLQKACMLALAPSLSAICDLRICKSEQSKRREPRDTRHATRDEKEKLV